MPARLIVTRPAREAARWVDQLQQRGIPALALPLIDIVPEPDNAALLAARAQCGDYAAVMFVSAQAVRGFFKPNQPLALVQSAQAATNSGVIGSPASAVSSSALNLDDPAQRPPWWDRLPPEVQKKVLSLPPEERRAYLQELRERRKAVREAGQ